MNEQTGKIKLIFTIVLVSVLLIAFALITKTALRYHRSKKT